MLTPLFDAAPTGSYDGQDQKAFGEVDKFLHGLGRKTSKSRAQQKMVRRFAAATNNRHAEGILKTDGKWAAQIEKAIITCIELCEKAAFRNLQQQDIRDLVDLFSWIISSLLRKQQLVSKQNKSRMR